MDRRLGSWFGLGGRRARYNTAEGEVKWSETKPSEVKQWAGLHVEYDRTR